MDQPQNKITETAETKQAAKPIRIAILLPTNAYFMSGIRDFTLSFIKNATHFSEQWAFRFQSIVDELCNNAIEYGSSPGQDIKLTLTYYPVEETMEIITEDTGTAPQKKTADEIKKLIEERRKPGYIHTGIRGRGLSNIVTNWSDSVEIKDIPGAGIMIKVTKKVTEQERQETSQQTSSGAQTPTHVFLT